MGHRTVAIASAFEDDDALNKINICTPGYRDETGKLFVPPTVRYAEKQLHSESMVSREALPIEGHAPFLDAGVKFAYGGDSHPYRHKRVNLIFVVQLLRRSTNKFQIAAVQAVSLTGALRLAGTFLSRFPTLPPTKTVFIPSPTTDEDVAALQDAGLEIRSFRFLDLKTGGVDWESLREDLQDAPMKSIVLLHVSGSVPSGAELTTNQWRLLASLLQVSCAK